MPIQAPKNHVKSCFWGVLTPKLYFLSSRPPKGTSLCRNMHFEPSLVVIGYTVWSGCYAKSTKKKGPEVSQNLPFLQTLFPSSHINQILYAGSYSRYLSWFWVSERWLKNVGAVGVEFLAFPLTWHITYTTTCCYRTSCDFQNINRWKRSNIIIFIMFDFFHLFVFWKY